MKAETCPDCGAEPGKLHEEGCDVERCPRCGGQMISCFCIYEFNGIANPDELESKHPDVYQNGPTDTMLFAYEMEWGDEKRMPWSGQWPGIDQCEELGLWAVLGPNGWIKCGRDDPGALPDLNSLALLPWDREARRRYIPNPENQ